MALNKKTKPNFYSLLYQTVLSIIYIHIYNWERRKFGKSDRHVVLVIIRIKQIYYQNWISSSLEWELWYILIFNLQPGFYNISIWIFQLSFHFFFLSLYIYIYIYIYICKLADHSRGWPEGSFSIATTLKYRRRLLRLRLIRTL